MSEKRQRLIDTAIRLFAQHGFHNTGIDWIAEEAKVSKKTMYHHFRSKEELILAALRHHDGLFRNHFMKSVNSLGNTPYERLLAMFDVAHDWFSDQAFYGCMFINAVGEYANPNTPIRDVCRDFKKLMRGFMASLVTEAGISPVEQTTAALAILLEGSIVSAQVSNDPQSARTAKAAAKVLIDNALKNTHKNHPVVA
ncbi:MAG: TetR/AcrR family transcriptional regulator [Pseudomonadota bacterium]